MGGRTIGNLTADCGDPCGALPGDRPHKQSCTKVHVELFAPLVAAFSRKVGLRTKETTDLGCFDCLAI
jgi:hypothetical protein